ncbi:MAG: c-type cytochrome, partial [Chlorobiales bacterium]|nr:c-type cytochrome [Chlorobiales bacterium]
MAMPDSATVVKTLKSITGYVEAFKKAFPEDKDPVSYDNLGKAIGAFERKLVTPSRWDQFLSGDKTALTDEEKKGFNTFVDAGCASCHSGPFLGGKMFQKLGLAKEWHTSSDSGRVKVTHQKADQFVFKVASLRNIAETGPYFHDGSIDSLHKAVSSMAEVQLNKKLTLQETQSIVGFLKTLTGKIPSDFIQLPKLPENGANTPKPKS